MNKDQIKGTVKQAAGKIQEQAGRVTGSKKQQAKGIEKQVSGKVTQGVGDVKESIRDAGKTH